MGSLPSDVCVPYKSWSCHLKVPAEQFRAGTLPAFWASCLSVLQLPPQPTYPSFITSSWGLTLGLCPDRRCLHASRNTSLQVQLAGSSSLPLVRTMAFICSARMTLAYSALGWSAVMGRVSPSTFLTWQRNLLGLLVIWTTGRSTWMLVSALDPYRRDHVHIDSQ